MLETWQDHCTHEFTAGEVPAQGLLKIKSFSVLAQRGESHEASCLRNYRQLSFLAKESLFSLMMMFLAFQICLSR